MAKGFIYKWTDHLRNMYYIGSHEGDIDDGYISSSRWFNAEYNFRPNNFSREILEEVEDLSRLKIIEYGYLSKIKDAELGKEYYNLKQGAPKGNKPWNKGLKNVISDEQKMAISISRSGVTPWNKGKSNPDAAENGRKGAAKLAESATGRKRKYLPDGSWTWFKP